VAACRACCAAGTTTPAFTQASPKATDNYIDGWVRESRLRAAILTGNIDVFSGNPLDAPARR
jgi:hypothetical protein